jgi:hypothetical protein
MTRLYSIFVFLQIQLWNESCIARKRLTYDAIFIPVEAVDIELDDINSWIIF